MEQTPTILEGYTDMEKGAYLAAIASIASADRTASDEELDYLNALSDSAKLSEEQKKLIRHAATDISGEDLNRCLDVLKGSNLRFSLISDLIAFAESDQNYSPEEKQNIEKIAAYLGINQQQFSLLDQFTKKAVKEVPAHAEELQNEKTTPQGFLSGLGFGDKIKNAGIDSGALLKGALGIMGPIILAQMFRGGRSRGGMRGGGMLGGGLLGGLMGGGLLGGLLGGGRGFGNAGGLLGRALSKKNRSGW